MPVSVPVAVLKKASKSLLACLVGAFCQLAQLHIHIVSYLGSIPVLSPRLLITLLRYRTILIPNISLLYLVGRYLLLVS